MKNSLDFSFFLPLICLMLSIPTTSAQNASDTSNWETGGNANLNFSQIGLRNWSGGGQSSISISGSFDGNLNYKDALKQWDNNLHMAYGVIRQGPNNEPFRKSDDELSITTKYKQTVSENWGVAAMLDFNTVMNTGYEYSEDSTGETQRTKISEFMAPGYLISSIGMEFQPNASFYILISPIAGKSTFVLNDSLANQGKYGVEKGENIRYEIGPNVKTAYKTAIAENVTFNTKVNLFASYGDLTEIDVDWKVQFNMKVNDFLSANVSTHLIYDEDVDVLREDGTKGPAVQFKEVVAVGLNLTF